MNTPIKLAISFQHHEQLRAHFFPGDNLEAAAILICARSSTHRYVVNQILPVPYTDCSIRLEDRISWPGMAIEVAIDQAVPESLSIILIHSHPSGLFDFSAIDDDSDRKVIPSIFEASDSNVTPHGSAIMTPDGAILARLYDHKLVATMFSSVACSGDDILIWHIDKTGRRNKTPMAFSTAMGQDLKKLTACVVGVSGTGSIVVEQLARLGIGRLILIDFDRIEFKNLNRILNVTIEDASNEHFKVDRISSVIKTYRDDIEILSLTSNIAERDAIELTGQADVLFCCVDSFEGRHICDRMSSTFLQPLFDVAVTIPTRQKEGECVAVGDVYGRVDYIKPGGSTLSDRQVYSPEALHREYMQKVAPSDYNVQVAEGYIKGVVDEAPSVISLNMRAASDCVMEFIARLYPFRHEPNRLRARTLFSLAASEEDHFSENMFSCTVNPYLGRGLIEPLLGKPCFDKQG